jgi:hypothetical protein
MNIRRNITSLFLLSLSLLTWAQSVSVVTERHASPRERFAAEYLQRKLTAQGYRVKADSRRGDYRITLSQASDTTGLKKEGFTIERKGKHIRVVGNDGTGVIYGCNEVAAYARRHRSLDVPRPLCRRTGDGAARGLRGYAEAHLPARPRCLRVSLYTRELSMVLRQAAVDQVS